MTADGEAFENRLRKRARHLDAWARREGVTAYRLFDRDIPGWHFAIDRYADWLVVHEYPWKPGDALHGARRDELLAALPALLDVPASRTVVKVHARHRWGESQYGRAGGSRKLVVAEGRLRFEVDLGPRLDTGLFLDHRRTRALVGKLAAGRRVLNLFSYTGAFSVYAGAGGAREVTSVDLSRTYLDWLGRNLALNGLGGPPQRQVAADARTFLREAGRGRYDLVVLDPPSHSASRRAGSDFEVQRDHRALVEAALGCLAPGGVLIFSCNLRDFTLDPALAPSRPVELTPGSLPEDFRGQRPHRAWRFDTRAGGVHGIAGSR